MKCKLLAFGLTCFSGVVPGNFINGDFELGIEPGWTIVSGTATTITGEQGDADAEALISSRAVREQGLGVTEPGGESRISQTIVPPDRLHHIMFSYQASASVQPRTFTGESATSTIAFSLSSLGGTSLAAESLRFDHLRTTSSNGWRRHHINFMEWARSARAVDDEPVSLKFEAIASASIGTAVGSSAATIHLDDVELIPFPDSVLDGSFESGGAGWFLEGDAIIMTDGDADPDKEIRLIAFPLPSMGSSSATQWIRIDDDASSISFSFRSLSQGNHTSPGLNPSIGNIILYDRNGRTISTRYLTAPDGDSGWVRYTFNIQGGLLPRGIDPPRPLVLKIRAGVLGSVSPIGPPPSLTVYFDDVELGPLVVPDDVWMVH